MVMPGNASHVNDFGMGVAVEVRVALGLGDGTFVDVAVGSLVGVGVVVGEPC
jgi:hypothetical protein